jgi:hypothetical protein
MGLGATVLTPSPVPPRLEKTPVAGHPLPQRGEGSKFKSTFARIRLVGAQAPRKGEAFPHSKRQSR